MRDPLGDAGGSKNPTPQEKLWRSSGLSSQLSARSFQLSTLSAELAAASSQLFAFNSQLSAGFSGALLRVRGDPIWPKSIFVMGGVSGM